MYLRRSPAIVLSLVLGAAALSAAPALAKDGGAAKEVDRDGCTRGTDTWAKLKVDTLPGNDNRLQVVGVVYSDDSDLWDWRLKHNGDVSDEGRARGREDVDRAFRVTRTMLNYIGTDTIVFRAENLSTGEVCRATVDF
ncbi:MAG TPA: hypothetical protein VFT70_14715 [Nocardioides sp.]|nr:hypothetical protein [Nocardioides sp.]